MTSRAGRTNEKVIVAGSRHRDREYVLHLKGAGVLRQKGSEGESNAKGNEVVLAVTAWLVLDANVEASSFGRSWIQHGVKDEVEGSGSIRSLGRRESE